MIVQTESGVTLGKQWEGAFTMLSNAAVRSTGSRTSPQSEMFPPAVEGGVPRSYADLPIDERSKLLKERLKKYCQKARGPNLHAP
jgi:DNA polymerase epsilon subunit 1